MLYRTVINPFIFLTIFDEEIRKKKRVKDEEEREKTE